MLQKHLHIRLLSAFFLFAAPALAQDYEYVEERARTEKVEPAKENQRKPPEKEKEKPKTPWRDKVFFGGSFGLQFGTITLIDISPLVGIRLTRQLQIGTGFSYKYFKNNRYRPPYSTTILGGRFFARYQVIDNLFLHLEHESFGFETRDSTGRKIGRRWYHNVLVGGGYSQPLGRRSALNIFILYNLNHRPSRPSVYSSPWITRIDITF